MCSQLVSKKYCASPSVNGPARGDSAFILFDKDNFFFMFSKFVAHSQILLEQCANQL